MPKPTVVSLSQRKRQDRHYRWRTTWLQPNFRLIQKTAAEHGWKMLVECEPINRIRNRYHSQRTRNRLFRNRIDALNNWTQRHGLTQSPQSPYHTKRLVRGKDATSQNKLEKTTAAQRNSTDCGENHTYQHSFRGTRSALRLIKPVDANQSINHYAQLGYSEALPCSDRLHEL